MAAPLAESDEDLLALLASSPNDVSESRLKGFSERFIGDASRQDASALTRVVREAQDLGFDLAELARDIPAPPASSQATASLPTAFDSPDGQLHLDATTALLQCSRAQALELSLEALIKATATQNISSFLGTSALLEKVLHYYCCQKIARLTAIGELLRLEQQEDDQLGSDTSAFASTLNAIDETVRVGKAGLPRGIFRVLLAKIMTQQKTFHIDQLLPAKPLCKATTNQEQHAAWQRLNAVLLQIQQAFYARERVLAMQALSCLLYSRMSIYRQDLVVLLLTFQANESWFSGSPGNPSELPSLAGIIGVESMALWRVVEDDWVAQHPLMEGLLDPQQEDAVMREMELIKGLLDKNLQQLLKRKAVNGQTGAPESLVVLAYGLLLKVAHAAILLSPHGANSGAYWQQFNDAGMKLCQDSNRCGSFEYFRAVMVALVPSLLERQANLLGLGEAMDGQGCEVQELDPTALIFASIGRELLSSAIVAFEGTLLSVGHDGVCDNVGMMCTLATLVYQNSPTLCQSFWFEWEHMDLDETHDQPVPTCRLLDKSYELATKSQYADSLPGIAPLLRLVSAIVYDSKSTELVLTLILPSEILMKAIYTCASTDVAIDYQRSVLRCVLALSRIGNSACRTMLRDLLQGDFSGSSRLNGPKMLVSCVRDEISAADVLSILDALVKDAPERWVLESALVVIQAGVITSDFSIDGSGRLTAFFSYVGSVAKRVSNILWSTTISVEEKTTFITCIERASRGCAAVLTVMCSTFAARSVHNLHAYDTAYHALKCLTSILVFVRPAFTSDSFEICDSVRKLRSTFVSLVTQGRGLCEAALYFSVLPITLSLASELYEYLREAASLLQSTTRSAFTSDKNDQAFNPTKFLIDKVENVQIKFEGVQAKGWLSGDDLRVVLLAASQAITFLSSWASIVDDMVAEDDDTEMLCLSPYHILSSPSVLPAVCRTEKEMLITWSTVDPPCLSLLVGYMSQSEATSLATVAIDFLRLCLVHSKLHSLGANGHRDSIIRTLSRSETFKALPVKLTSELLPAVLRTEPFDHHGGDQKAFGILRMLSTCADFSASMVMSVLGKMPADVLHYLSAVVVDTSKDLERHDVAGRPSTTLLHKTNVACHCLGFILSVLKQTRRHDWRVQSSGRDEVMKSVTDCSQLLLLQLSGFLFRTDKSQVSAEPIVDNLLALILDLLSTEICWSIDSTDADASDRLLSVLEPVIADRFVVVNEYQTTLNRFSGYCSLYSMIEAQLASPTSHPTPLGRLIPLLRTTSRIESSFWSQFEPTDFSRAPLYFTSVGNKSIPLLDLAHVLDDFAIARRAYMSECHRIQSWGLFCNQLLAFSVKMRSKSQSVPFFDAMSLSDVARSCAYALLKHLKVVESTETVKVEPSLVAEALTMAGPLANFLLHLLESFGCDTEAWITIVGYIGESLAILPGMQVIRLDVAATLLGAGLALFSHRPTFESGNGLGERSYSSVLKLITSCCGLIRKVEPLSSSVDRRQWSTCFRSSVSLLLSALPALSTMKDVHDCERLVSRALDAFADGDVIQTICRQAALLVPSATTRGSDSVSNAEVVVSCLSLLTELTSLSGSKELSLQIENAVSKILLPVSAAMQSYNRLQSGCMTDAEIDGAIQTMHRACLDFVVAALLAASEYHLRERRSPSSNLAINYLLATKECIRRCLERCSGIPSFCLTLNDLREARSVLAVCAQLCCEESRDSFSGRCHELLQLLLGQSRSMVVTLGSFLGASAAARERFAALDVDQSDSSYETTGEANLAIRLLKSGAPNTKHEAIRFSHFRYEHYSAISAEEKSSSEQFSEIMRPRETEAAPQSLSSLEYKCRATVSCNFAFELELAAAECLLYASSVLWKTHPASAAMVEFTPMEVAKLDAFSLVRVGSNIAFRRQTPDSSSLPAAPLSEGKVLRADTFNREWHVRGPGSGDFDCVVRESELAGIEDAAKLRCIFVYRPAPDTANELEASLGTASMGHLILALRWCHNVSKINDGSCKSFSLLRQLSDLLAQFVAKELSIHQKLGSPLVNQREYAETIANQLYDLLGIEHTSGTQLPSDRCIEDLLSSDTWLSVRGQLYMELADPNMLMI